MITSSERLSSDIFNALTDEDVLKVTLVGERGVGKTWMAKQVSYRAITKGVFDVVVWVFLCIKYDAKALSECISRQLSFPHDHTTEANHEKKKENEELEEMNNMIRKSLVEKSVLVILDDEGCKMKEADIMPQIKLLLPADSRFKVLITTANHTKGDIIDGHKIEMHPFDTDESIYRVVELIDTAFSETSDLQILAESFVKKSRNLHRELMVIGKALNYLSRSDSGMRILESALEEALETENYNFQRLFFSGGYDPLPVGVLTDLCQSGPHFFRDRGSVHYNELITYWILEGYLGQVDSIEHAYKKGHEVLMELLDCQILTPLESSFVGFVSGPTVLNTDGFLDRRGFGGTASLGLATLFDTKWKGLGRSTHEDGAIKTLICNGGNNPKNLTTLLIDGQDFGSEVLLDVPQTQNELKILALFNPSLRSPPFSLSKMTNLSILVLRGCIFMEDFNVTLHLKQLIALEISGASSVKIIPADFFENVAQLRRLNLSGLGITSLPTSLYELSELRWLVIRGCSCLEKLQSLHKLTNLVLVDLAGATSLKLISDKSFSKYQKLQTINLSGTKIQTLPMLTNLGQLTHLLLSECTNLGRLRSITSLTNLRVLDISGSTAFNEFHNRSLAKLSHLEILDLSETSLEYLPPSLGNNPHSLYLKRCLLLKQLSIIKDLHGLKLLDLSGSSGLDEMADGFFQDLTSLQVLNLSETNLREIPSLSNVRDLRQLLLSRCVSLEKLPKLTFLKKLEVLDASECYNLTQIQDISFEHMFCLQRLDLSATKIQFLPPLSDPSKLRQLILRKCTDLKLLPSLKSLAKLEVLNLSGVVGFRMGTDFPEDMRYLRIIDLSKTDTKQLPSMSNFKNLSTLSLEGCKSLKTVWNLDELVQLEAIDLSGTAVTHLPDLRSFPNLRELRLRGCSSLKEGTVKELNNAISELTCLEMFEPPNMIDTRKSKISQEESNQQYPWIISNWHASDEEPVDGDKFGIPANSTQFLESLEENHLSRSFTKFHFLVHPTEAHNFSAYMHSYRDELVVRDIFFHGLAHHPVVREQSLEIRGFRTFPEGIQAILGHAQFVYLIENSFLKSLSDLGIDNIKRVKACWVERCEKIESIIHVEEETAAEFGDYLEIMWVSHAISLKNVYSGNLRSDIFTNLKCFHLEYCPTISNVFLSSQRLQNLEVLRIKFCDKLKTLFVDESSSGDDSLLLPRLEILDLWALPCLKKVGCVVPALLSLKVGECPMLANVISSLSHPENLEIIHIQSCHLLETVIQTSLSTIQVLANLRSLHMWELPELKSVGAHLPPLLKDRNIRDCPKLELITLPDRTLWRNLAFQLE